MRNLGKCWQVKVRYWYKESYPYIEWKDSGISTDTYLIEADAYDVAAENVLSFLSKKYSNEKEYKNVHIEAYNISEYSIPGNFLVKEY